MAFQYGNSPAAMPPTLPGGLGQPQSPGLGNPLAQGAQPAPPGLPGLPTGGPNLAPPGTPAGAPGGPQGGGIQAQGPWAALFAALVKKEYVSMKAPGLQEDAGLPNALGQPGVGNNVPQIGAPGLGGIGATPERLLNG